MSDTTEIVPEQTLNNFQDALNRHGYGFHYSVLSHAKELETARKSSWAFEAAEFPVEVQSHGTRIDFVLHLLTEPRVNQRVYIVAECKRVNPAMSNWCFIPAPIIHREGNYKSIAVERVLNPYGDTLLTSTLRKFAGSKAEPYHIAIEVKANRPGDASGGRPQAIEEAATQVCRGFNGLLETIARRGGFVPKGGYAYILPVIFTTADLWASDADLGTADRLNGNIDLAAAGFSKKDWLLYEYHMSPGLKHTLASTGNTGSGESFATVLESEYIRTIPVVSSSGIADFLDWAGALELPDS